MREKDLTEKILEQYNDVFADIVNGVIFGGKDVVKEEDLNDTTLESSYRSLGDGKIHGLERDVAKIWEKGNTRIALYGLENQTKVDKYMPLRVFGYEGASYRDMLNKKEKEIYPIVSIILYFGEENWNAPNSLKEVLKERGFPTELEPYINDCKINIVQISSLKEAEINKFHNDFKAVATLLSKEYNKEVFDENIRINHPADVFNLINAVNKSKKLGDNGNIKEVRNMQNLAKMLEERGYKQGYKEAYREANQEARLGVSLKMLKSGKYSIQEIADVTGFPADFLEKKKKEIG